MRVPPHSFWSKEGISRRFLPRTAQQQTLTVSVCVVRTRSCLYEHSLPPPNATENIIALQHTRREHRELSCSSDDDDDDARASACTTARTQ